MPARTTEHPSNPNKPLYFTHTHMRPQAIKCCYSWLLLGVSLSEMGSLTELLFCCLSEPDLMESAADVLCEVVVQDDSFKYANTVVVVVVVVVVWFLADGN